MIGNVPRDLEAVALKALRKNPADRYPTAQAFAKDLQRWLNGEPVDASKTRVIRRLGLWGWRNPGWAAAVVLSAVLVIGGLLSGLLTSWAKADAAEARGNAARAEADAANERER